MIDRQTKTHIVFLLLFFAGCFFVAWPAHAVEVKQIVAKKTNIRAWLVEDHTHPIVALRVSFDGGSEQDPVDKQGLSSLMASALTAGAGSLSGERYQKMLADHSISIGFSAGRDEIEGGMKCLAVDKQKAIGLFRLALTRPRFDLAEVDRLRAQQLSAIRRQFSNPGWQARYALLSHIFDGHPYSQRYLGTTQTLSSITQDDLRAFARERLARDNVVIAAAGAITEKELAQAIDAIFHDLPPLSQNRAITNVVDIGPPASILVAREGAQTELLFALPGPKRDDPDFYAAEVANYILGGGGFSSRLMDEVRGTQGLTYGISTSVAPSKYAGLIIGRVAVDNPNAGEAFRLTRDTMRGFFVQGPSDQEITAAKDYLTGSMPLALTSSDKIASLLVYMQRENLGVDYLERFDALIRNVSKKDIRRVLERFFNPDRMIYVMVGKPEGIVPKVAREAVKE